MIKLHADFETVLGPVKPMNAVNNGPMARSVRGISNFDAYRELEIPYARNHDASFFTGYGGEHTVDVHRIFKNFDADENDPASYVFEPTDHYTKTILEAGTKVFYRLGASIEHGYKYGTYPPRDFAKWARICEHIIRHYNEGWANGFRYGIEYWEIWNEPDCCNADGSNPCWQGTEEQFIEFYAVVAKHLKACFPNLKIGGPAFTSPKHKPFQLAFLKAVKEQRLPLDFYSFHRYFKMPEEVANATALAAESLRMNGLCAELILNEWNYVRGWLDENWIYTLRTEQNLKGASFITGSMCMGQASELDMLMYYDARPCGMCGMFDIIYVTPLKGYYPFLQFRDLRRLGTSVEVDAHVGDLYAAAATDGKNASLLLTRYDDLDEAPEETVEISLRGLPTKRTRAEICLLDATYNNELIRTEQLHGKTATLTLDVKLFDSILIKLIAE